MEPSSLPHVVSSLAADAMYFHAAQTALEKAVSLEKRVRRVDANLRRLFAEWDNSWPDHPTGEVDIVRQMSQWDAFEKRERKFERRHHKLRDRSNAVYGPFLQALATVQVMCAACLESYINIVAGGQLEGRRLVHFDRLSLEGKWLLLPTILGFDSFEPGAEPFQCFARLVRHRNALLHYKPKPQPWSFVEEPQYLASLGLTVRRANESIAAVRGMILRLVKVASEDKPRGMRELLGYKAPDWLTDDRVSYFRVQWQLSIKPASR